MTESPRPGLGLPRLLHRARIGELVALGCDDVPLSARKGPIIIRSGKGRRNRDIPAYPSLRENLHLWIHEAKDGGEPALFNPRNSEQISLAQSFTLVGAS
ncbi:hypothetical protein [Arthrobacter oryzae]|uniref:hypothetical protein n=1 Tax=Arthrobacter oryzae TaxID=409290 RepID=UPI0011CE4724|nr:hypothetical protein [Arthrobacter oryzae]